MDVIIRTAVSGDLLKIQELSLELLKKEKKEYDSLLNLEEVFDEKGIFREDGYVFVAVADGEIVGYMSGGLAKVGSFGRLPSVVIAEMETFFVLDKFRSLGIGKKLYDKFIEWSKGKSADKVRLDVHPGNKLAIKFYRNRNFKDYYLTLEADL
jgi:ribosomal protein S18 acetylase RimI-like enzyme